MHTLSGTQLSGWMAFYLLEQEELERIGLEHDAVAERERIGKGLR